MLRKLIVSAALAALLASPAAADSTTLLPGVTYEKRVELTPHGPVVLHVLTAPRPGGLYGLRPVLSDEAIVGRERLTAIERRLAPVAVTAGIGGDLFSEDGRPAGVLLRGGTLEHVPQPERSSIGIDAAGSLRVERVQFFGTWQGSGPRRALVGINEPPGGNGVSLYTPSWGPATPPVQGTAELQLFPFPPVAPNGSVSGPVVQVGGGGSTSIPAGGAVLVARGTAAEKLREEAPLGQGLTIRPLLKPEWRDVPNAIGGGPLLVRDGTPVFRTFERFPTSFLAPRAPRAAVGQRADGTILLVVVDGRRPGYSVGMTSFELAQALMRLGAVTAAGLDAGDSAAMAFDGQLLSRSSDPGGERAISDALVVSYEGVYAPLPSEPVLSPNGDGVADQQSLSYRVVRPSTVTSSLVAPDGSTRLAETQQRAPGVYPTTWTGTTAEGAPEPEGAWRWVVNATDDQGRASSLERVFYVNSTLAALAAAGGPLPVPVPAARTVAVYTLARPAQVQATIVSAAGTAVRRLPPAQLEPGAQQVAWDGRDDAGQPVYTGRYRVRVAATNAFGRVELEVPLAARRVAGK